MDRKKHLDYKFLIDKFGEDVITDRYSNMETRSYEFIKQSNMSDKVMLNQALLDAVLIDYFTDLSRLKDFERIERANKNKITAFMSYWWLRRKPLQIIDHDVIDEDLIYINEKFIATLIAKDFMHVRSNDLFKDDQCKKCLEHIFYHLRYRVFTAQTLELFLMGVDTGIQIGTILSQS